MNAVDVFNRVAHTVSLSPRISPPSTGRAPQAVVYRVRLAPIVIIVPPFLVVVIGKVGIRIRVHEGLLGVPSVADIHVMTPEELASAGADQ